MKKKLYLTQTDTIIGFISQDINKLNIVKNRLAEKFYIKVVNSLYELKKNVRVPNIHKNRIRRNKRTTFIMPNKKSYRVIKNSKHNLLLNRLKWAYSSSANLSGEKYNKEYAKDKAEVIISSPDIKSKEPSRIFKISNTKIKKIR